jgi:protein pelota
VFSPGFLKDDFMVFFEEQCVKNNDTPLLRQKSKFFKAHTTSGHKHSIEEILTDPSLKTQLMEVKAAGEVRALERFYAVLSSDQDRACYGLKDVTRANEQLAVDELLVTDTLFKAADIRTRQKYVALVDSVRDNGGKVYVFSCLHVSGVQLNLYTGIAAILRHPMPEIDDEETLGVATATDVAIGGADAARPSASSAGSNNSSNSSNGVDDDIFNMSNDDDFSMFTF